MFLFLVDIYLVFSVWQQDFSTALSLWHLIVGFFFFLEGCMGFVELGYKEAIHINKVN